MPDVVGIVRLACWTSGLLVCARAAFLPAKPGCGRHSANPSSRRCPWWVKSAWRSPCLLASPQDGRQSEGV
ncbi:hypothetical protein BC831DRAFT_469848 [Entophlyctis helioformis]|nr:hypothetical protein BC831DRAFT_469848 [Entophlyctis helioformis]